MRCATPSSAVTVAATVFAPSASATVAVAGVAVSSSPAIATVAFASAVRTSSATLAVAFATEARYAVTAGANAGVNARFAPPARSRNRSSVASSAGMPVSTATGPKLAAVLPAASVARVKANAPASAL